MEDQNNKEAISNILKKAGWWSRYWAFVFDGFAVGIYTFILLIPILFLGLVELGKLEDSLTTSIITVAVYFVYTVFYLSKKGFTMGKDSFGLKVVDKKTGNIASIKQLLVREFLKVGILIIPVVGQIFYLINSLIVVFTKNGLHERFSNTIVIKIDSLKPNSLTRILVAILLLPIILLIVGVIMFFLLPMLSLYLY